MSKQLTELKTALSILETPQSPRDSQIIPKISPNDSNNYHSELLTKNSNLAISLETSRRKQKFAGSISTQGIPIVDLVSDSEIDSEAETLVDFETCSQIQISWVYSLQTWGETINTPTNRSVSRIRILEDRILHPLEQNFQLHAAA